MSVRATVQVLIIVAAALCAAATQAADKSFHLQEATIDDIHAGIRSGELSCRQVVEAYVARARAYNGFCARLVTADGAKVSAAKGAVRAGSALKFPTETLAISKLVPDFDKYIGMKPDYGRMEPTLSDPTVLQQYGMVAGMPKAGQVNALETLNLRGERSVSCKAGCDAASGDLPASCPKACDAFRKQPDALERAAELDKQFGRNPDLKAMPLYCVPMSFKAVYDAKDMRTTGGGDVNYAMDVPPKDSTLTARLRAAGAIVYAQAHNSEYNAGSGDPGGDAKVLRPYIGAGGSRESWGGMTCNPYDTERVTSGSSGGSAVSVAANLVVCSICETTGGSCRGPANYQGVVNVVPTKGMISYGGGIGANPYQDRPGIMCRTVKDSVKVLDAFRDTRTGSYFDARDPYTALPRGVASKTAYASALSDPSNAKPLAGVRIGVIRELMVKDSPADAAVSDGINAELKVLKALGAELVESTDPKYPDDPSIPNMEFDFNQAIAEILPFHMPEVFSSKKDGKPEFEVAGWDVASRKYLVSVATHNAPLPTNLNFRRVFSNPPPDPEAVSGYTFAYQFAEYLMKRGDARVFDWASLNSNAKYFNDVRRAAMKNWENKEMDIRTGAITYTMKRRDTLRMVMMKVLEQNHIDVFVNPVSLSLQGKIGGATVGGPGGGGGGFGYGAMLGIPEVFVPAGFANEVYDPTFVLAKDGTKYEGVEASKPTRLAGPLPYNIAFWAGPGEESTLIKVGSAYEAASHRRKPPAGFGPLAGEP
ncbi:amidase family protein [Nevskia sp.]|uniref:amidase family protein n=1 Tax=Nevskia sp. TaxID=1929292 RepID=UPI0025DA7979|nr:amidase family protein [Nevskia sp.]